MIYQRHPGGLPPSTLDMMRDSCVFKFFFISSISCLLLIPLLYLIILYSNCNDYSCLIYVILWLYVSLFLIVAAVVSIVIVFVMFCRFRNEARDPVANPTSIYPRITNPLLIGESNDTLSLFIHF